ncbi:MAG: hypothetical protein ACJA1C_002213 [Crocinitomicaceae bacterium]|jgi:hypothetical protein
MNLNKQQAIDKATTILEDINFMDDDVINPSARLMEEGLHGDEVEGSFWLVSYEFGAMDFGPGRAFIFLNIYQHSGELVSRRLSKKGGSILIKYNALTNKYERDNS